jgi:hypothetical protein
VERVVLNALATKTAVAHLTFNIEQALVRDVRNLGPSAVCLRIVFGEADTPLANAKDEMHRFRDHELFPSV